MAKLTDKDFDYYKHIIGEDETEHRREMTNKNLPKNVINAYEGLLYAKDELGEGVQQSTTPDEDTYGNADNIVEDWLAIAVDTIVPGLYYQAPLPNITARPQGSPFTAEVLNGLTRHYCDDNYKKENQRAIIDAYLPYGYGVVKVGYNTRVGIVEKKRSNLFTGKTKADGKTLDSESSEEYIKYERPFVERVSPKCCFLDKRKEFGKGQHITVHYDRTLQELMNSNLYQLPENFVTHFRSKTDDNRKVKIKIKEHWNILNGYAWKLVYTDDWHEELYWSKTPYQWLPFSLLRFKEPPDTLYPRSNGSLANAGQKKYNYLGELIDEQIDKTTNMTFVDENGLSEDGKKTFANNKFGAIVGCVKSPAGVAENVTSGPISNDILGRREQVRAYLQTILSAGGSVSGDVEADTATQERNQQLGNFIRTSGMQDAIRDFNNDQIRKMSTCIVNWGDPKVTVAITKRDIADPETGEIITGKDVVIGGDKGLSMQELIIGNIESDYLYDMNMASAARPDYAVVRKQLMEALTLLANLKPALNSEGKQVELGLLTEDMLKTFDALPDAQKYIRDLTPEEQQAMQEAQQQEQLEQTLKGASKPTEQAMVAGAESTGIAQGTT